MIRLEETDIGSDPKQGSIKVPWALRQTMLPLQIVSHPTYTKAAQRPASHWQNVMCCASEHATCGPSTAVFAY